jgi:hypothetical protein
MGCFWSIIAHVSKSFFSAPDERAETPYLFITLIVLLSACLRCSNDQPSSHYSNSPAKDDVECESQDSLGLKLFTLLCISYIIKQVSDQYPPIHTHTYIHTRTHTYTHTHARTHTRTHARTHARMHTHTHHCITRPCVPSAHHCMVKHWIKVVQICQELPCTVRQSWVLCKLNVRDKSCVQTVSTDKEELSPDSSLCDLSCTLDPRPHPPPASNLFFRRCCL